MPTLLWHTSFGALTLLYLTPWDTYPIAKRNLEPKIPNPHPPHALKGIWYQRYLSPGHQQTRSCENIRFPQLRWRAVKPENTSTSLLKLYTSSSRFFTLKNFLPAECFAVVGTSGLAPAYFATTSSIDGCAFSSKSSEIFSFLPLAPEKLKTFI